MKLRVDCGLCAFVVLSSVGSSARIKTEFAKDAQRMPRKMNSGILTP
jgi:ribosomal protein S27E